MKLIIEIGRRTKYVEFVVFYMFSKKIFCKMSIICIRISLVGLVIIGYNFGVEVEFILYFLDVKDMKVL